ncbi:MAG: choice-of-anchor Q domain-containing protein [Dokdonella sp.]
MSTPSFRGPRRSALFVALACSFATHAAHGVVVTSPGDTNPARTDTCTLRQAMNAVNVFTSNLGIGFSPLPWPAGNGNCNYQGGDESVQFDPALAGSVIHLAYGELGGFGRMSIEGRGVIVDGGGTSRVMRFIAAGHPFLDVVPFFELTDITLRNGHAGGNYAAGAGGGLVAFGRLILSRVNIVDNHADVDGGGIHMQGLNNGYQFLNGMWLDNCTISGNSAERAGGIESFYTPTLLNRTTISGNSARAAAGGLEIMGRPGENTTLTLVHSTISGNTTTLLSPIYQDYGGGILEFQTAIDIEQSTITGNTSYFGGGIAAFDGNPITVRNSIISGNTATSAVDPDLSLGAGSQAGIWNSLISVPALLGPLADNGGRGFTHLPLAGSPAIDGADDAHCVVNVNVLGYPLPSTIDARNVGISPPQGAHCDIGAVERRQGLFPLGVTVSGNGRVDAAPLPAGPGETGGIVSCRAVGGSCSAGYADENESSTIRLTPTADSGWHLTGWNGDCAADFVGTGSSVTMDAPRSCNATFAIDQHPIGGVVQGLIGSGLVLQLNGANNLPINGDGRFAFAAPLDYASAYAVSIATQPTGPAQTCFISHGNGVADHDVGDVAVICANGPIPVTLSVAIDDGRETLLPGDTPTYAITVGNDSDNTAYNIALATTVTPAGSLTGLSWTCSGTCTPPNGTGAVGLLLDLPPHSQATVHLDGTVVAIAGASRDVSAQLTLPSFYSDTSGTHAATDSDANPIIFRNGFDGLN